ncbi:MAG TPA: XRE family transcriptional regulator, partial [Deltaproteobacteria bacterium]|nr:XRE family transcriptional regulator [Deltaproteobacteria bacterium]
MDILKAFGRRLHRIRELRGLTQEELEERSGVNTKYISAIERGQKNITIQTAQKLACALEVELYELFLFQAEPCSKDATKKAIESLLKEADQKSLTLCLEFL